MGSEPDISVVYKNNRKLLCCPSQPREYHSGDVLHSGDRFWALAWHLYLIFRGSPKFVQ